MSESNKVVNTANPSSADFYTFCKACLREMVDGWHGVERSSYRDGSTYKIKINVTSVLGPMGTHVGSWALMDEIIKGANKNLSNSFSIKINSMGSDHNSKLPKGSKIMFIDVHIKAPNKYSEAFGKSASKFNEAYAQHVVVKAFSAYCGIEPFRPST